MVSTISTPRGDVTIRPTRAADAPAYRDLRLQGLRDHPEAFGSDFESSAARPIEYWQERMRLGAGGEHGVTYVAEAAGELIGVTTLAREELRKIRHNGNIYGVYTRPDWRGAGVADALLEACVESARQLGVRVLKLGVTATNTSAIRLYLRRGFTVYGVDPQVIYHDGVYYDELLMARKM